jgi:hypothetical protein
VTFVFLAAYVFALTEQTLVAVIGAVAILGAAGFGLMGVWIQRNVRDTKDAIGTPNGHGNVIEMMERLLSGQTGQDGRLASLEGRMGNVEALAKDAAEKAALVKQTLEDAQARADEVVHGDPGAAADAAAQSH